MGRWIGKTVGSGGGREGLGLVVVVVGGGRWCDGCGGSLVAAVGDDLT